MTIPEDFKTRLKIAKSKIKKQAQLDREKRGSFMGSAFKLGTELVSAVAVGTSKSTQQACFSFERARA